MVSERGHELVLLIVDTTPTVKQATSYSGAHKCKNAKAEHAGTGSSLRGGGSKQERRAEKLACRWDRLGLCSAAHTAHREKHGRMHAQKGSLEALMLPNADTG